MIRNNRLKNNTERNKIQQKRSKDYIEEQKKHTQVF